jgi:hypothetical protein
MELITLCGAVIVAFGLWIELEILVKMLVKAARGSRVLMKAKSLFLEQKPVFANRYVEYTPREFRRQHT